MIRYDYSDTAPNYGETRPFEKLTLGDQNWWTEILGRLRAVAEACDSLPADVAAGITAAAAGCGDIEDAARAMEEALEEERSLLCRDADCEACGARAARLSCADCGRAAVVTDCGHKAQPRPIAGSEYNGDPVCADCEDARRLAAELRRVFAARFEVRALGDGTAEVATEEWPEAVVYRVRPATAALRDFDDGHGATAAGDAEVCSAVERAGALVGGGRS